MMMNDDDEDDDAARNAFLKASYLYFANSKSPSASGESLTTTQGGEHSGTVYSYQVGSMPDITAKVAQVTCEITCQCNCTWWCIFILGSMISMSFCRIQAVAIASIECIQQLLANLWVGALGCSSGFSLSEDCWRNIPKAEFENVERNEVAIRRHQVEYYMMQYEHYTIIQFLFRGT